MDVRKIKYVPVIIFCAWIALWINFVARDLVKKGDWHDYLMLLGKNAEYKRSYTYGDDFYAFLRFAKYLIPPEAKYEFVGLANPFGGDPILDYRRGVYYLYPLLESNDPDYVLVYKLPDYERKGFNLYAGFNEGSFILKKER